MAERFRPHVLLVQGEIAAEPPGKFMDRIHRVSPHSKVVITASALIGDMASRYIEDGASGVVSRSAALSRFVACVREALNPKAVPVRAAGPALVITPPSDPLKPLRPSVDTLTQREKNVIACLMQGLPNKEISRRLSMAEQTVKNHLCTIFDKIGVSDRLELVLYAIHHKLELPLVETREELAAGTGS